jgi:dTMP kinase
MPLIVLEGIDGVGKTTQLVRLTAALRRARMQPLTVREPGTSMLGKDVREVLMRHNSMNRWSKFCLFMAARAQTWEELVRPALAKGQIVLMDRFVSSTAVYQFVAKGIRRQDNKSDWGIFHQMHNRVCDGYHPDLTLLLDADPKVCWERAGDRGRDTMDGDVAWLTKLRDGYLSEYHYHRESSDWRVVDANRAESTVYRQLHDIVWEKYNL